MERRIVKIELDEQIQLADSSNWIFDKSHFKGCLRAIKLKKNGSSEFIIDEIYESSIRELQYHIEKATGSLIGF